MHVNFEANAPISEAIQFADFLKVDIRVGTITECLDFPEARNPSYKLVIDFGEGVGLKKSSAQLTGLYTKEVLVGKKVMAVVNFPPRQIGKFMSEVLVLGFSNEKQDVVLLNPDFDLPNGSRLH